MQGLRAIAIAGAPSLSASGDEVTILWETCHLKVPSNAPSQQEKLNSAAGTITVKIKYNE